jgi:hypothetical protein
MKTFSRGGRGAPPSGIPADIPADIPAGRSFDLVGAFVDICRSEEVT